MARRTRNIESFLRHLRRAVTDGRLEIRAYAADGIRELAWKVRDVRQQLLDLVERGNVIVVSFHRG